MEKAVIETPAGFIGLCWTGFGLVSLKLPVSRLHDAEMEINTDLELLAGKSFLSSEDACEQVDIDIKKLERDINAYFDGKPVPLSFPVDWNYYTDFQKRVLQKVCSIPWGQVVSYGKIAAEIGKPGAARAVGGAVGSNRALLVIPCHRVIAHNGTLGGFSGGLDWKRRFLKLEGVCL